MKNLLLHIVVHELEPQKEQIFRENISGLQHTDITPTVTFVFTNTLPETLIKVICRGLSVLDKLVLASVARTYTFRDI